MKKNLLIALAAAAISTGAITSANATEWYVQGTGGLSLGSITAHIDGDNDVTLRDEGFNGRIGAGAYLSNNVRIGLESGYAAFSENATDIDVWDILAVAYYDFKNETAFTPYIGLGAGFSQIKVDFDDGVDSGKETTNHFSTKLGAGVGYEISENLELLAEYSFQYNFKAEAFEDVDYSAHQNQFNVGLRYSF
ncbi:outer membrane beta-barrel protein [Pseudovibrio sp. Ad26]|uniref:outer membrane protein n=1 Tax=Pseudovibrio sp. Ad26 TaxID=989410 RepID=UPI0007AE80B3|nr:outer membrane beta-barrel protein [Pseudovibrio sp. Ad26]KZK98407.1 Outer membrane protein PagN precursor [Pseudovibrio sp. Ad26]